MRTISARRGGFLPKNLQQRTPFAILAAQIKFPAPFSYAGSLQQTILLRLVYKEEARDRAR
ncbi:hypothetical protein GCM10027299_01980 [Larkinella ripae]